MILSYEYGALGHKPRRMFGLGFIVRRSGTDTTPAATLVGKWGSVQELFASRDHVLLYADRQSVEVYANRESVEVLS